MLCQSLREAAAISLVEKFFVVNISKMDEALLVAITVLTPPHTKGKPVCWQNVTITCMMVLECQKPETEVCPSDSIIRDKHARNEKRRKNNKHGSSTITSCLVLTGEGNNDIVDAVFFATFSTITETKNKYKILSNRSGLNENEIDQFRYIKIQPNTIVLSTRLWGINPTNSVFIPHSLLLRSIVLG